MTDKTLSIGDLIGMAIAFCESGKATIVSITSLTDARALKTGNPFGTIYKRSITSGMIGFNYSNAVNNRREREDNARTFEAHPRKWGNRVRGLPVVVHAPAKATSGKVYLEVYCTGAPNVVGYFDADGKELTAEQVAPFLPVKSSNAEHQGVEKEVVIRDFNVGNIERMSIGGDRYDIDQNTRGEESAAYDELTAELVAV